MLHSPAGSRCLSCTCRPCHASSQSAQASQPSQNTAPKVSTWNQHDFGALQPMLYSCNTSWATQMQRLEHLHFHTMTLMHGAHAMAQVLLDGGQGGTCRFLTFLRATALIWANLLHHSALSIRVSSWTSCPPSTPQKGNCRSHLQLSGQNMCVRALHAFWLRKPVPFGAKILMHASLPCSMGCKRYVGSASMLAPRQDIILSGPGTPRGPLLLREESVECWQGLKRAFCDMTVFQYWRAPGRGSHGP